MYNAPALPAPQHPDVAVQVAATTSSLTFYTSEEVLSQARQARAQAPLEDHADDDAGPTYNSTSRFGIVDVDVDVWTDEHEWGVSCVSRTGCLPRRLNNGFLWLPSRFRYGERLVIRSYT
jgi:hypothetical protein